MSDFKPGWYLSPLSCSNEHARCAWMVFQLTERDVEMVKDVQRHLKELEEAYGGWGSINMNGRIELHVLEYLDEEERFPVLFPALGPEFELPDETAVYIGEHFDRDAPTDDEYWRSECAGLKIYDEAVYATALDKYTSDRVESVDIFEHLGIDLPAPVVP